ncbi:MAG: hypothetical protein ILA34_06320 [Bacteroidaceae bacterium]|nr:hypothetical protein [Bacteroidaceae bacterium]
MAFPPAIRTTAHTRQAHNTHNDLGRKRKRIALSSYRHKHMTTCQQETRPQLFQMRSEKPANKAQERDGCGPRKCENGEETAFYAAGISVGGHHYGFTPSCHPAQAHARHPSLTQDTTFHSQEQTFRGMKLIAPCP